MTYKTEEQHKKIMQNLDAFARKKLSATQAKLLHDFVNQYYANVSVEDLLSRDVSDLFGSVLSQWQLVYQRVKGERNVRVYNPSFEENGWQSTHTVIEIAVDDMPFLVDSLRIAIIKAGLNIHFTIHAGGIKLRRNPQHQVTEVLPLKTPEGGDVSAEAPLYFEVDRETNQEKLAQLHDCILSVLEEVNACNTDWCAMREQLFCAIDELKKNPPQHDPAEISESIDFLTWLADNHFTFLGYREYHLIDEDNEPALKMEAGSGLGVLRNETNSVKIRKFSSLPPLARKHVLSQNSLIISKTNTKATIHRPAYTDYIGVKRFNHEKQLIGERRFIGLYTSEAYHSNPAQIPLLRLKIAKVIKNSQLPPNGHGAKTLMNILETLPRDELFQSSPEELTTLAMNILQLQERRKTRLFIRKDIYHRFISCLVYTPKDIINTELVETINHILQTTFHSTESAYSIFICESILARIDYQIRTDSKKPLHYDLKELEKKLVDACRSWSDELRKNLVDYYGEETGNQLANKYRYAFPASYRENFIARNAVFDIEHIESLSAENPLAMIFYQPLEESTDKLHFKLFHAKSPIPLSDALPILENMGLRVINEQPHEIITPQGSIWINDFSMIPTQPMEIDVEAIQYNFQDAFAKIWSGQVENDGFNRLILSARLNWQETTIFRAYTKHLRQTGFTFSQPYIEQSISNHPTIAKQLIELFKAYFDPNQKDNQKTINRLKEAILQALNGVNSLDEDRIIRRFVDVISATLRTNYFQKSENNQPKNYLALKLNAKQIPELPLPYPLFETFVYSPRFEAVHLRNGKVARGGIRWSDRPEDFRVEILGLMKAQDVKNAVIVPSGAKGGFVPKYLPADRDELMTEVTTCYKTFIGAMLDITDNIINGEIIPPKDVIRYDEDDPYLVVAADKGTATFSDIANAISCERNFWLGDAFASGGSTGYDHKKMGITARGAWESVKRHFRELHINPDENEFTVIGIGDMSGDVFGNGMLLSKHIKLVAAFNHQHIFIDPNPNASESFTERQRLFHLPRSTWEDYNATLISKGGGVFKRSEKSISLTPEIKALLHVNEDSMIPSDLIRAILTAEVDLLWNGGIGTYVKASSEAHHDVGDRSNDSLRINGHELRCKVVGEGGNLGFTQLGRIEYELNGGLIYTDFIDNSAGVNCSDHEVNIKILLNQIIANGDMTGKQRNQLLADMTDEVAELVLKDNFYQPKVISLAAINAVTNFELYAWYINQLEHRGKINRSLEFLPDDKSLLERKLIHKGLTRPELAILLSYSKNILKDELLQSNVPEDPYLQKMLSFEFPTPLRERFYDSMQTHSLKREIISTQLSNLITNRMGATFVDRLQDETGATTPEIVRAYIAAREIFHIGELLDAIEAIDNMLPIDIEAKMVTSLYRLMRRSIRWLLRHCSGSFNIQTIIDKFSPSVKEFQINMTHWLIGYEATHLTSEITTFIEGGAPHDLATQVATTSILFPALDIIEITTKTQESLEKVATIYFSLGETLELDWLRNLILAHPVENHWEALARAALRDDMDWQQKYLTLHVLQMNAKGTATQLLNIWSTQNHLLMTRWQTMLTDLRRSSTPNFIIFFVAVRELMDLGKMDVETC